MSNDTASVNYHRAARIGRIVLRREPTAAEATDWAAIVADPAQGPAKLISNLLASDEVASYDEAKRIARSWDAAFNRYDPDPPASVAHWQQQIANQDMTLADLPQTFVGIAGSGYRFDPCASPVTGEELLFAVRDAAGSPLIFTVGENKRLYLFRRQGSDWQQVDLSAAIPEPVNGHVLSLDVKQTDAGAIAFAVAVGPRRGPGASMVYVATGLSNALDEQGWLDAMRTLYPRSNEGAIVSKVEFAPLDGGGSTLLLVGAAVLGITNTYYFDVAAPTAPWTQLRIPEDADRVLQYALGRYRRPGIWTLYKVGPDVALTFSAFPDKYGKTINISYTGLPANATSFLVVAGSEPGLPDVFVAGDGVAVYRGDHDNPGIFSQVKGARLVWSDKHEKAEHLVYVDSSRQLMALTCPNQGDWSAPYQVVDQLEAAALLGDPDSEGLLVVAVTPSHALELRRIAQPGSVPDATEVQVQAVWEEIPLTAADLRVAMSGAAPMVYFDPDEEFFTSNVEFFLSRVGLWNEIKGEWQLAPGSLLDPASNDLVDAALAVFPRSEAGNRKRDSDYVLKIDDADYHEHDGKPALPPGHPDGAPAYVHAKFVPSENATDLNFWLFYPYNGAGVLKLETPGLDRRVDLSPLGIHEGDWEHFLIRVDNDSKLPVKLYLSAHDGGAWVDVSDVSRDQATGRMTLYASRHGHAAYTSAGDNLFHENQTTLWHIGLVNHCGQGQSIRYWEDGRAKLIAASFLEADAPAEPKWLQLPWRWGRYHDFTRDEIAGVIESVLGPIIGSLPIFQDISQLVAHIMLEKDVLGGEGNSAGPGAVKFKSNWFGGE